MFTVLDCITHQHDIRLVVLATLICLLGNTCLFVLLKRASYCVPSRRGPWLIVAASTEGVAVWATHFIGMLAYEGAMPIGFGAKLTFLSVAIAIACFWLIFASLGRAPSLLRSIACGSGAAGGVAAMHFTGIASIIAPARITFDIAPTVVAFGLSGILFSAAFHLFSVNSGYRKVILPALPATLSIAVLHFTAMSATTIIPDPTLILANDAITGREWLVPAIGIASILMIILSVAGAFIDRWLTDALGLADATLEGIAIVSEGRVIEINKRLSGIIGVSGDDIIGQEPSAFLQTLDGKPLSIDNDRIVEARARNCEDDDQILEVATHLIEYRGRSCDVLAIRDLSDRKRAQREIEHLASHDPLTDLPNRAALTRALDDAIDKRQPFALLALDLDRFKIVNDIFGHGAGDAILCRVANLLRSSVRGDDVVARMGGDEFLILQRTASDVEQARKLAARILETLAADMDIARDPMAVSASIGVALYPQDGIDAEILQQNADTALYRAKNNGRANAAFFDQAMDDVARERRTLEHDLRHAASRNQLYLVFQPLVATTRDVIIGYETLLRWNHPVRGDVPPDFFIPIAEEIGAIVSIGEWVLYEACAIAASWPSHISIAVNVSTVQFEVPTLSQTVKDALEKSGLDGSRLELEITETAFIRNRENALKALHEIRELGVRIAIDDFGTGYSSLSNLKSFPFDKIKIDKSFVAAIEDDEAARSIVRAIIGLGRSFNLPIVAEGVETQAQHQMVIDEGCPQAQGFYFGEPAGDPYRPEDIEDGMPVRFASQ